MNVPKLLRQAEKLISYGKVNEAIGLYQEILSDNFHNTAVHSLIADLYISKQDLQRASRHLFKVAADYSSQGDQAGAATVYRKIISALPRNILAREKLLEIFSKNGAKNEILNLISELCTIYEGEGNTYKVIECLEKLVSLDPSNKNQRIKLALFLNEKGMKDKAVETFSEIARDFLREDRFEDALASLEKIRVIDPKDRNTHLRIAEVHEKQGKVQKAIEVIQFVLAEDPAQPNFLPYLAKLYVKAGRIDEAEGVYEKLVNSNKDFLPETLPFVEILIVHRRTDRAVGYIENLYREIKDNKEARKKCVELLEEVLKLDPQNLEAYRLLEAFYSSSFQFDQLAITLLSHADAYVAKCEYSRALDLAKQLVDLEPYNEDYRKKYQFIEKLSFGGIRTLPPATPGPAAEQNIEDEADEEYANASVDSNFDQKVSLVTDEDVENFIIDIELLEKFGQQVSAIRRLEQILKTHPQEIKLRQKLKAIYVDRKMPKKAAQECLEIAKILQSQDQKEQANRYLREAQRLNPLLSSAKRAPAASLSADQAGTPSAGSEAYVALKGDLSEIGLLDVIQVLDNAQKCGKLIVNSDANPGTIFFNSGRIVNATYQDKVAEPAVYALVAVKGGSFEYKPSPVAFDVVINNSNTNLLLEGLRLLDEANRDQWEGEAALPEDTAPLPTKQTDGNPPMKASSEHPPTPKTVPVTTTFIDETNPLEEL
jgi:tetratricopeptide (TPR) repeat protein